MKFTLLLVCYSSLILREGGEALIQHASECPSLNADKLARLKNLVVKENIHEQVVGTSYDLWGPKVFFEKDPKTCTKHTTTLVNDTVLGVSVVANGKWFGPVYRREGYLKKVDHNVYLEIVPSEEDGDDLVLAKVYVVYAKNGIFAYFWCVMFEPSPESLAANLPSLAGVSVHPKLPINEAAVSEAVDKIQKDKDIFGDIQRFKEDCSKI